MASCLRRYTGQKTVDNYSLRDLLVNLVLFARLGPNIQKTGRLNSDEEFSARFAYNMHGSIYVYISMYTEHSESAC